MMLVIIGLGRIVTPPLRRFSEVVSSEPDHLQRTVSRALDGLAQRRLACGCGHTRDHCRVALWLARGRKERPQWIQEIPGSTAEVKSTDFADEARRVLFTLAGVGIGVVVMVLANMLQKRDANGASQAS
jgi:hypothetical protein